MKKLIYLLMGLLSIQSIMGQEIKPLSLKQAILEGRTVFAPERIRNLQWIKGTDTYSYIKQQGPDTYLMRGYTDSRADEEITSLNRIANGLKRANFLVPEAMPNIWWHDGQTFLFKYKGQFWSYDILSHQVARSVSAISSGTDKDLAPNGRVAAFTFRDDLFCGTADNDSIRIASSNGDGVTIGKAVHRYEFGISKGTFWSPDSRKLAFYVNDQASVGEYSIKSYWDTPASDADFYYPMAGSINEEVSIMVYDLESGSSITLDTGVGFDQYLTNVTWGPNGKFIYVAHLNRGQNHMQLIRYNASTGKQDKILFEEKHPKYVEPEHAPYFLEGRQGEFLWFSERDGYQHLYHYKADGELISQLTKGDIVVLSIEGFDTDDDRLYFLGTNGKIGKCLYSVSIGGGKMKNLTPEPGTHSVTVSEPSSFLLDTYSSMEVPGRTVIRNSKGEVVKELLNSKDPLRANVIGTTEIIEVQADDGSTLYGRLIKPSNFNEKEKYPVLVYVYGGPHAQLVTDSWLGGAPLWMYSAAERGMLIFTLDGRGSANRGLEFEQAVFRNLGVKEMKDQLAGIDYLKALPYVDSGRLAVHGWSFGGFMTCSMMLRQPGTFKVGVAGGPVTDWQMYEVMYTERYMDTPAENPEGYQLSRLYDYAPNLQGELMLIHGTSDDIVVMQHSMTLLNGLINAEKQVDFFVYPGHGHNVRGKDRVHLMTKVLDFIEEGLAPE